MKSAVRLAPAFLAIFLALFSSGSSARAEEDSETRDNELFSVGVNAGARVFHWLPSAWTDSVSMNTSGFSGYNIDLNAEYGGVPFFTYKIERPFSGGTAQDRMLEENKTSVSGIDKYSWGAAFRAFVEFFKLENPILKNIATARVVSTHETYFGDLTARSAFVYVTSDAQIESLPDGVVRFYGAQKAEAGETLAFKTGFNDLEITFAWPSDEEDRRFDLRLGYFESEWSKPFARKSGWLTVEGDLPILFEGVYRSRGVIAGVETVDRRREGFNGNLFLRYGLENKISSAVTQLQGSADTPLHGSVLIDVWNNWYPAGGEKKTYVTIGASYDRRLWATKIDPGFSLEFPFFFYRGAVEADTIFKLYAMAGF